ncbi:unnamed protein product [Vitrella brassicaformis CCMP3155]|uniref:Alpha-galactosidase n=2 Tax=Vitrella brassicaformis TaxID=1169539 RepID=A0A0G4EC42_VITBC|nr:unnamed protein product [Vitrella brassicaformis CCMP3155]|eukprot:CEL93047.1 unnamed protein product [Vitrella brassicaformis CCMP3155]
MLLALATTAEASPNREEAEERDRCCVDCQLFDLQCWACHILDIFDRTCSGDEWATEGSLDEAAFMAASAEADVHALATQSVLSVMDSPSIPDWSAYVVTLSVDKSGRLRYAVDSRDPSAPVMLPSALGISVDGHDLGVDVELVDKEERPVEESYVTRGKHNLAEAKYNDVSFTFRHRPSDRLWHLDFRLFPDGLAFRYSLPATDAASQSTVNGEASHFSFRFMDDDDAPTDDHHHAWFFQRDRLSNYELRTYAGVFQSAPASSLASRPKGNGPPNRYGAPLLFHDVSEAGAFPYRLLTEAALYEYPGMRFLALPDGRTFAADLADEEVTLSLPFKSPWRVILLARTLDDLINNNVITSLNPPPDPALFPSPPLYARPGRSVWRWWRHGTGTPVQEIQYIDKAAELGFEYTTIDEGWADWPDKWATMEDMCEYGREKGVGVVLWKDCAEVENPENDYNDLRKFLDNVKATGAVGVKFDFFNSESIFRVRLQTKILTEAAKRQLFINFHGIQKPTGEWRSFPNELTREAVWGLEINKMSDNYPPIEPSHNAALPWARFVLGAADYTPLALAKNRRGPTTVVHQVALLVLFDSPLQTIAEDPFYILDPNKPHAAALDVIKAIPTTWQRTRAVAPSSIGRLAVMARKTNEGDVWFLAAINGLSETQTDIEIPVDFLDSDKVYDMVMVYTVETGGVGEGQSVMREERRWDVGQRGALKGVRLLAGDGIVVMWSPVGGS